MTLVYKNGIYKTIDAFEYGRYLNDGWKKISGMPEQQAPQEDIKVVDDLTVTKEEQAPAIEEQSLLAEQQAPVVKPKKKKVNVDKNV